MVWVSSVFYRPPCAYPKARAGKPTRHGCQGCHSQSTLKTRLGSSSGRRRKKLEFGVEFDRTQFSKKPLPPLRAVRCSNTHWGFLLVPWWQAAQRGCFTNHWALLKSLLWGQHHRPTHQAHDALLEVLDSMPESGQERKELAYITLQRMWINLIGIQHIINMEKL